jgi:hypothetical protein
MPSAPVNPEPAPTSAAAPPPQPTAPDAPAPPVGAPPADAKSERQVSPLVYGAWGVGGVGILVGSVTGILSLSRAARAKEHCVDNRCSDAASADIDASMSLATVADVSFVVGGAFVAVGAVAWVLQPSRPAKVSARWPALGATEVAPAVGPRWIGVTGRF